MARAPAAEGADVMLNGFGDLVEIEQLRERVARKSEVTIACLDVDLTKAEELARLVGSASRPSADSTSSSTTPACSSSRPSSSSRLSNGTGSSS